MNMKQPILDLIIISLFDSDEVCGVCVLILAFSLSLKHLVYLPFEYIYRMRWWLSKGEGVTRRAGLPIQFMQNTWILNRFKCGRLGL